MTAIDATFERIFAELHLIRAELGELRAELTRFQRHMTMIHTALAVALVGLLGASQLVLAASRGSASRPSRGRPP